MYGYVIRPESIVFGDFVALIDEQSIHVQKDFLEFLSYLTLCVCLSMQSLQFSDDVTLFDDDVTQSDIEARNEEQSTECCVVKHTRKYEKNVQNIQNKLYRLINYYNLTNHLQLQ